MRLEAIDNFDSVVEYVQFGLRLVGSLHVYHHHAPELFEGLVDVTNTNSKEKQL